MPRLPMTPALQKSTSSGTPRKLLPSAATCLGSVTSATCRSTSAGSLAFASRTVPITRQRSAAYWRASSCPRPRPAPVIRIVLTQNRNQGQTTFLQTLRRFAPPPLSGGRRQKRGLSLILLSWKNQRDGEAVVALDANGLHRRRGDARLGRDQLVQASHALDGCIARARIDHGAVAHDVVDDEQAAGPRELERPAKVFRIVLLARVDERKIERSHELSQRVERLADADLHTIGETGARQIFASNGRMLLECLERDKAPAGREAAREPDRAVAAERADLEDALGAERAREEPEEFAVRGRNADRRQPGGVARLERRGERVVRLHQRLADITVDVLPELHASVPIPGRNRPTRRA